MTNKIKLKIIYILMVFYSIYDVLNSASAGNATDNRSKVYIFLFTVVISLFVFCKKKRFIPKINILIIPIVIALYYIIDVILIKGQISWSAFVYLGLNLWWIFTIWFFYSVVKSDINTVESIQNFIRVMFILYSIAIAYGAVNISSNYSVNFARVGYIYHLLAMLPMIFLDRSEKIKKIFLIITIVLTIFSFKRGAIIILPFMILAYYMFGDTDKKNKNILKIFFVFIIILIAWIIVDKYSGGFLSSRFTRAELSDGSGRSDIWAVALQNISQRNFIQLLFGISSNNERALWTGIHNEWISYLNSNGVFGVIIFGLFILSILINAINLVKNKSKIAGAYMALVVYILGVCMVSGFYHVHSTFYVMLFLGTTQGLNDNLRKIKRG